MGVFGVVLALIAFLTVGVSGAESHPVGLGTADDFAVLAGAGVTNTGPTVVNGDLGTCPTPTITGFPPGIVNGEVHAADAECRQAQSDLTIAYNDAAGRTPDTTFGGPTDLGGETLTAGVYNSPSSFAITGTLTLDAEGDPDAVFIFQAGSTLITATNSTVMLTNGAQACNVFWQVGSSATLGVGSTFVGTILALTSITANTGAEVQGRLLARNGAVTLDSNVITRPECTTTTTTTTTSTTSPTPPTSTSSTSTSSTSTSSTTSTTSPATTSTSSTSTSSTTSTTSPTPPTSTSSTTSTTSPAPTSTSSTTSTTSPAPTSTSSTSTTLPSTTTTTTATGGGGGAATTTTTTGAGGGGGGAGTTTTTTTATGGGGGAATTTTTTGAGGGGGGAGTTTTTTGAGGGGGAATTTTTTGAGGGGGAGTTTTTAVGAGGRQGSDGPAASATAEQGRTLPKTGSPVRGQTVAGVLAIVLGSLVLLVNDRRRGTDRS